MQSGPTGKNTPNYPSALLDSVEFALEYNFRMSEEQQRFDDLMKRVIKVSPEELKRRLA